MKARQTRYGAYLAFYILVVLAVVVGANWLANANNKSFDTTANKQFSLSDATKQVLKGLKSNINITYFDRTSAFANAQATLDRYKDQSSHIKLTFIDPEKKPEIARLAHVQTFGSIFVDNDATKKHEEAKSLTEEEITGAIKRSLTGNVRTACFVSGSGESSITDTEREGYSGFKDLLEKNGVKTQELPMLQKAEVGKDCTIVVIAGPTHDYIPPVRDAIKKYVDDGGKALVMFTPSIGDRGGSSAGEPELEKMAADWGVTVNNDLIYDVGPYSQVFGEAAPVVAHYDSQPIVKDMGRSATVFPLSRSLDVKGGSMEKLFETGDTSYEATSLSPPIKLNPDKDKKGPFTLGAAGTINGKSRVVVVGSSSWISNSALSYPTANRDLALNIVNWLTADESLISIPTKEPEDRRIVLSGRQMNMVALLSVIVLPLIVVLSGFAVWWKRR